MIFKIVFVCVLVCCIDVNVFVNSIAASSLTQPNVLDSFQKHMDQFKSCLDQALAKTVDEVNVKQVQPVFDVLGDQLNRFSKAFEDLTATKAPRLENQEA